jgi:hypothetical protein
VIISGLVDGHLAPVQGAIQSTIPEVYAGTPGDPEAVMGPHDGFYSWGHDPVRLAANLGQTRVYMAVGDGRPSDDGEPNGNNLVTDVPSEAAIIRPASDNYAAALTAAGIDLTYEPHEGIHDFANFRRQLRDAFAWGVFEPVDEHPTSWVNDTVATRGKLWEFAYRFDTPPDRIVRFRRSGDLLTVSAAGSAVTVTTDDGCVFHVSTPATIELPCILAGNPERCRSQRVFTIHLKHPIGDYTRSARVSVDGKSVRVKKGRPHFTARIDLRGQRKKIVIVRIVSRTLSGRVVRETRRYRTCTPGVRSR